MDPIPFPVEIACLDSNFAIKTAPMNEALSRDWVEGVAVRVEFGACLDGIWSMLVL